MTTSKTWESKHTQVKFWLPNEKYAEFERACQKARKPKSSVLHEAVDLMLESTRDGETGGRDAP